MANPHITYSAELRYNKTIERQILTSLKGELDGVLSDAAKKLVGGITKIIDGAIKASPEYQSLVGGKLKFELGVPDAKQRMEDILDLYYRNIVVNKTAVKVSGGKLVGSLKIENKRSDWKDLIGLPAGRIITKKGTVLPWLEWLLLSGNKIIIRDWDVKLINNRRSRTGGALMVEGKNKRWRVPPEFSGTSNNNFITRALEKVEPNINRYIEKEIINSL